MAEEISLFSGYSQKENLVTNYTGLLFKLIYEENPELFEEFIQNIFSNIKIGPLFSQQQKGRDSVFDLVINQVPFSIVIETKLTDWFYDNQLTRHLEGMKEKYPHENVYLLLLSNFSYDEQIKYNERFPEANKIAKLNKIEIKQISFEELGKLLSNLNLSPMLERFVKEYQDFLEQKKLLSTWKKIMKAVPVGDSLELNKKYNIYYNPKYSYSSFQYLGLYSNKAIREIGKIIKIVDRDFNEGEVKYNVIYPGQSSVLLESEQSKISSMVEEAKNIGHDINDGHRFYIVEKFETTNYIKYSVGGLQGHKNFNLENILNIGLEELTIGEIAE
ncbi:MAG: hypothetical protein ACRCX2_35455, partial [Paraclostridium sp.]